MISADIQIVMPEILLSLYAMLALLGAVYTVKDGAASLLTWATAGLFVLLAVWIGINGEGAHYAFDGMFVDDSFSRFAKIVILVSAAAVLVMSEGYMAARNLLKFEYPVLVALAVVGMMVMVSAGDLMALYMGLELQSLALYVVASLRRDSVKSTEAGLKYFVLGPCRRVCCFMARRWSMVLPARPCFLASSWQPKVTFLWGCSLVWFS